MFETRKRGWVGGAAVSPDDAEHRPEDVSYSVGSAMCVRCMRCGLLAAGCSEEAGRWKWKGAARCFPARVRDGEDADWVSGAVIEQCGCERSVHVGGEEDGNALDRTD